MAFPDDDGAPDFPSGETIVVNVPPIDERFDDEKTPVEMVVPPPDKRPDATTDPEVANKRLELAAMAKAVGIKTDKEAIAAIEYEISMLKLRLENLETIFRIHLFEPKEP